MVASAPSGNAQAMDHSAFSIFLLMQRFAILPVPRISGVKATRNCNVFCGTAGRCKIHCLQTAVELLQPR